jgi:hypothetical protein
MSVGVPTAIGAALGAAYGTSNGYISCLLRSERPRAHQWSIVHFGLADTHRGQLGRTPSHCALIAVQSVA